MSFATLVLSVVVALACLNVYFLTAARHIIHVGPVVAVCLWLILFLLILGPGIGAWLGKHGMPILARTMTFAGYSWSMFVLLFFATHIVFRIVGHAGQKLQFFGPAEALTQVGGMTTIVFIAACITAGGMLLYARHQALALNVKRVNIVSPAVPAEADGTVIAQISDVHFSATTGTETAKTIANIMGVEKPDIIVSTGDLLDRDMDDPYAIEEILKAMPARLGKYAVTGNHEFYSGINEALRFTKAAGFTLLHGDAVDVGNAITLIGVDDIMAGHFGLDRTTDAQAVAKATLGTFTILLKHRPDVSPSVLESVHLQLSGHTHNGQFYPFTLLVKRLFPYTAGLYQLDEDSAVYTSQGTGTWGPPFRFLTEPEITIFTLHHQAKTNAPV
ncbi:metallophosphoesterase [Desulfovibrio inopinatus]|uniref:metallophosphoesterase n=1 Tax=Desulfovibrio inopinatus TaxID=102109 RepID=UPI0003FF63B9|nr:metallophosphoesterase [Desulfovibrio inopinatus]